MIFLIVYHLIKKLIDDYFILLKMGKYVELPIKKKKFINQTIKTPINIKIAQKNLY